jgi:hypothetical protein
MTNWWLNQCDFQLCIFCCCWWIFLVFCFCWQVLLQVWSRVRQLPGHLNSRIKFQVKSFRQLHSCPFDVNLSRSIRDWPWATRYQEEMRKA